MPTFVHGKNSRVYWNALDVSAYLNSAGLSATIDTGDSTTFGSDSKTYVPGQRDRTFTSGGLYDKDLQIGPALAVEAGVLTFCPGGASAIGDLAWMSSIISTTYDQSAPVADLVAFSWDAQPSGYTAPGYVLHPLAVDTGTTTGATRDDGAANAPSATGWVAHLHVTAVSSGSWVIVVDDSSTGSSGWATIATFTAATGATQQRLVSAAATTSVKRYLRYVATVTGGSSPTITFVLSFARSNP